LGLKLARRDAWRRTEDNREHRTSPHLLLTR
jgi:hypothetical protein